MITSWEGNHPKFFDEQFDPELFTARLLKNKETIFENPLIQLPVVKLTPNIRQALAMSQQDGKLIRGLTAINQLLQKERTGLRKLEKMDRNSAPKRISRIVILSNDGSYRFQNDIAQMLLEHSPRLAGLILDCDSTEFWQAVTGKQGVVKALLANHKNSVNLILSAIGRSLFHEK